MLRVLIRYGDLVWLFGLLLFAIVLPNTAFAAPGDTVNCTGTQYPLGSDTAGSDPFLLSDPGGLVHLFAGMGPRGELKPDSGGVDAILHMAWDGKTWSEPNDIFLSPPEMSNKRIMGIRGTMDDRNNIHLVWIGPDDTFFYSAVHADMAGSAQAWRKPLLMSNRHSSTQYATDIAFEAPSTLHVLFGRSEPGVNRTVAYLRSEDLGLTWTEPVDVHVFLDFDRGPSNIGVYVNPPGRVYATWTEWDDSGNGQAVYFVRSLDSGRSWDEPIRLATREENDYERDWANLAVLDNDHLVVLWEGGFRAYPQMQYSDDGGATWSEAIDQFYWLIADNGFAEFARDGDGRLHVFLARRIREGHEGRCSAFANCDPTNSNTIWHSVWEGGRTWREPKPVGGFVPANFTALAIRSGNEATVAWFTYGVGRLELMTCELAGTTAVAPLLRPTPTPTLSPARTLPLYTPEAMQSAVTASFAEATSSVSFPAGLDTPMTAVRRGPQVLLVMSLLPSSVLILLLLFLRNRNRRHF